MNNIPALPEPWSHVGMYETAVYTADQMRAYGEQCRAASGEAESIAASLEQMNEFVWCLHEEELPHDCKSVLAQAAELLRALSRGVPEVEYPEAAEVCAEAYQVVGCMLMQLGLFDTPEAEKILDNLSQHRMVHRDVLPWTIGPAIAAQRKEG